MRLPQKYLDKLRVWVDEVKANPPQLDFAHKADDVEDVFVHVMCVNRNWLRALFVHRWIKPDPYPPHDHPGFNVSIIVDGEFTEQVGHRLFKWTGKEKIRYRRPGDVIIRDPWTTHTLQLTSKEGTTVYIQGFEFKDFFYWCKGKWINNTTQAPERFLCERHKDMGRTK
jgi:hypothetical protein